MHQNKSLPRFRNVEEMANFFDRIDTTELELEDTDLKFERPKMAHVSVRIPQEDLKEIKAFAKRLGLGHTAFIRMVLHQAVADRGPDKVST